MKTLFKMYFLYLHRVWYLYLGFISAVVALFAAVGAISVAKGVNWKEINKGVEKSANWDD